MNLYMCVCIKKGEMFGGGGVTEVVTFKKPRIYLEKSEEDVQYIKIQQKTLETACM